MKPVANSWCGYHIIDRSRHTITMYLNGKPTDAAIIRNIIKKLDHLNNAFYEFYLAKAQIENDEPILVGFSFFNMQNHECWKWTTSFSLVFAM